MIKKKRIIREEPVQYSVDQSAVKSLKKIEKAVKLGLNKRSRLYKEVILKHQRAWEKLANL